MRQNLVCSEAHNLSNCHCFRHRSEAGLTELLAQREVGGDRRGARGARRVPKRPPSSFLPPAEFPSSWPTRPVSRSRSGDAESSGDSGSSCGSASGHGWNALGGKAFPPSVPTVGPPQASLDAGSSLKAWAEVGRGVLLCTLLHFQSRLRCADSHSAAALIFAFGERQLPDDSAAAAAAYAKPRDDC